MLGFRQVLLSRVQSLAPDTEEFLGLPRFIIDWFLKTGILGALFCVVVGQLTTRSIATNFPKSYMNSRYTYYMLWTGLAVAGSGIFAASWTLAFLFKRVAGLDRQASGQADDEDINDDESATMDQSRPRVLNW